MKPSHSRLLFLALLLGASLKAHAGLAIALNSADGTVSFIDTETYKVTGKAPVCKEMVWTPPPARADTKVKDD